MALVLASSFYGVQQVETCDVVRRRCLSRPRPLPSPALAFARARRSPSSASPWLLPLPSKRRSCWSVSLVHISVCVRAGSRHGTRFVWLSWWLSGCVRALIDPARGSHSPRPRPATFWASEISPRQTGNPPSSYPVTPSTTTIDNRLASRISSSLLGR